MSKTDTAPHGKSSFTFASQEYYGARPKGISKALQFILIVWAKLIWETVYLWL